MKRYLAMDVETGGLSPNTSLLTACFMVVRYGKKLIIEDTLELTLKPNDGIYIVEAGGLACNGINLLGHDKVAITYSKGGGLLRQFLVQHTDYGKNRLIPLGHGIKGDLDVIDRQLLGAKTLDQFLAAVPIDTCIMAKIMQDLDLLGDDQPINLEALAKYYCMNDKGDFHTANFDTFITAKLYGRMIDDLKSQWE